MILSGAVKTEQYCTYEEWLAIDDGNRYELINGELYMMASPTPQHQAVAFEIGRQLGNFLIDKLCRVYPAPFDVKLHKEEDTVFQPDISMICDPSKITKKGCEGAPDFIVEILSPSTESHDRITKFRAYRSAGVQEYWIVDPDKKNVTAYRLIDGKYVADVYSNADTAPIQALPGCEIDLSLVFRD